MAEYHAGEGLLLHICQSCFLNFGELTDLGLGELNIFDVLIGYLAVTRVNLLPAETEFFRRPVIKFSGIPSERRRRAL